MIPSNGGGGQVMRPWWRWRCPHAAPRAALRGLVRRPRVKDAVADGLRGLGESLL
jgi:hypothetical protein